MAAEASTYFVFPAPQGTEVDVPTPARDQFGRVRLLLSQLLGLDPLATSTRRLLAADGTRSIVISFGIVDSARLRELLTAPGPPHQLPPLAIRSEVVVPVADPKKALEGLGRTPLGPGCARRTDGAAWSAWLAALPSAEERRSAEAAHAVYACTSGIGSAIARVDRASKALIWVAALGISGTVTAVAQPIVRSTDTVARLERAGILTGSFASFSASTEGAVSYTALYLMSTLAGMAGVEPSLRAGLWSKAVGDVAVFPLYVESKPKLITAHITRNGRASWQLSAEGKVLFGATEVSAGGKPRVLSDVLSTHLKPQGAFASADSLRRTLAVLAAATLPLTLQFMWPHAVAFTARHGDPSLFEGTLDLKAFGRRGWRVDGDELLLE